MKEYLGGGGALRPRSSNRIISRVAVPVHQIRIRIAHMKDIIVAIVGLYPKGGQVVLQWCHSVVTVGGVQGGEGKKESAS
jgi:hypothetical protein